MAIEGKRASLWMAGTAVAALLAAPAHADTLRDALVAAYESNPTLTAARAQQRATDETVPLSKADGRPNADGQATYTEFLKKSSNSFTSPDRQLTGSVQLNVPVYSGGRVRNSVRAAESRVGAGLANLRGTESSLFSNVVAAYMDVIRDSAIVGLNAKNVAVLQTNLQATSDRFEIGDLTRTDVAQSESRLAVARSDLRNAVSNLVVSKETYIQLVGNPPGELEPPPPLPGLPETPDMAVDVALASNPDLIAAKQEIEASRYDVRVADGAKLPQVDLFTTGGYANFFNTLGGNVPVECARQRARQQFHAVVHDRRCRGSASPFPSIRAAGPALRCGRRRRATARRWSRPSARSAASYRRRGHPIRAGRPRCR